MGVNVPWPRFTKDIGGEALLTVGGQPTGAVVAVITSMPSALEGGLPTGESKARTCIPSETALIEVGVFPVGMARICGLTPSVAIELSHVTRTVTAGLEAPPAKYANAPFEKKETSFIGPASATFFKPSSDE